MQAFAPSIGADELRACTVFLNDDLFVVNKPGWLVCHPSKQGPWSSLAGAARSYLKQSTFHLVSRLDRETSGVVVIARNPKTASLLQKAQMRRLSKKTYMAILDGEMKRPCNVDAPLGLDPDCPISVIQKVGKGPGFRDAFTRFEPLCRAGGFTLCRVLPETGRKHQIRAHARHIGFPIVGDKLYGPDPMLYLEFIKDGWTPRHERLLYGLRRQALHAYEILFDLPAKPVGPFRAPLARELRVFALEKMGGGSLDCLKRLC